MAYIIDLLEKFTSETPNAAILFDDVHKKMTYAELDDLSGCLYGYLKGKGIDTVEVKQIRELFRTKKASLFAKLFKKNKK